MPNELVLLALKHKWQGRPLGEYTLRELDQIYDALLDVAPLDMRVPKPNDPDDLILAVYRLDTKLEPLRPLGQTPQERGSTRYVANKPQEEYERRLLP